MRVFALLVLAIGVSCVRRVRRTRARETGLGPPAWSADGRTIALASTTGLMLVNVSSRTAHRSNLNGESSWAAYPAFSPDGTAIAFATPNGTGGEDLVVARLGEHGARTRRVHAGVVYGQDDQEPGLIKNITWSRDGRRLSFTRILDTRTHRIVRTSVGDTAGSAASPDGRVVVHAGFDAEIASAADGKLGTTLDGLRAAELSWQPLCKRGQK